MVEDALGERKSGLVGSAREIRGEGGGEVSPNRSARSAMGDDFFTN